MCDKKYIISRNNVNVTTYQIKKIDFNKMFYKNIFFCKYKLFITFKFKIKINNQIQKTKKEKIVK